MLAQLSCRQQWCGLLGMVMGPALLPLPEAAFSTLGVCQRGQSVCCFFSCGVNFFEGHEAAAYLRCAPFS